MKTKFKTEKFYTSPEMRMCEMMVEAPIAASLGLLDGSPMSIDDATFDDWGNL